MVAVKNERNGSGQEGVRGQEVGVMGSPGVLILKSFYYQIVRRIIWYFLKNCWQIQITPVTPAKAGVQISHIIDYLWIPAFAGMTIPNNFTSSF